MADTKIFASIYDEATKNQVHALEESDAYKGCKIRVMPDTHAGKGCTIGTVIQFDKRAVPETVGVDIGCGMFVSNLGKANIDLRELDRIVNDRIPSGFSVHERPVAMFDHPFIADISKMAYINCSIGTLGGGNHFIELDIDDDGNKYLVIHSGSRNLGVQVCDYWQKKGIRNLTDTGRERREIIDRLKAEGRQREIPEALKAVSAKKIDNDLAYIEGEDLDGYLHDMRLCQMYATLNRMTMADIILRGLNIPVLEQFNTIHNYIDIDNRIIRKGAISAKKDELAIIPMNMRDGSLICKGKGNADWLWSAPHGAGRIMSRAKAMESVSMMEFQLSMVGIYSTSICEGTLDESPMVYKPMEIIRKDIEPTVEILKVIKPIYNFKAKNF